MSQSQLPSVITLRLDNMQPAHVNPYLNEVLNRFTTELEAGALVSVNEQAFRIRLLTVE